MAFPILATIAQQLLECKKRNEQIEGVDNGASGAINPLQFLSTLGSKKQGNQIIKNDNVDQISKKIGQNLVKARKRFDELLNQEKSFNTF